MPVSVDWIDAGIGKLYPGIIIGSGVLFLSDIDTESHFSLSQYPQKRQGTGLGQPEKRFSGDF